MNYTTDDVAGNGSFGVVYKATCQETGETVGLGGWGVVGLADSWVIVGLSLV